jgi:hypothetical protein
MLDPFAEEMLTAVEAAKLIPGRPDSCTVWRWMTRGVRGQKLESLICNGARRTNRTAIREFLARITAEANGESAPAKVRTSRQRKRRIEADEAFVGSGA